MNSKRNPDNWVTAEQLAARLEADPEWVAARDEREAKFQAARAERRQIEAPLVSALREAGYEVESVWDLVNTSTPYPAALPILVEHLQREYPPAIRDGIARTLAVRDARFAWPVLVEQYRLETQSRSKQGLAAALAETADDDVLSELISLIKDRSNEGLFSSPMDCSSPSTRRPWRHSWSWLTIPTSVKRSNVIAASGDPSPIQAFIDGLTAAGRDDQQELGVAQQES